MDTARGIWGTVPYECVHSAVVGYVSVVLAQKKVRTINSDLGSYRGCRDAAQAAPLQDRGTHFPKGQRALLLSALARLFFRNCLLEGGYLTHCHAPSPGPAHCRATKSGLPGFNSAVLHLRACL